MILAARSLSAAATRTCFKKCPPGSLAELSLDTQVEQTKTDNHELKQIKAGSPFIAWGDSW